MFCLEKRRRGKTKGWRTNKAAGGNPSKRAVFESQASSAAQSAQRWWPGVGRTVWVKPSSQDLCVSGRLLCASRMKRSVAKKSLVPRGMQNAVLFFRKSQTYFRSECFYQFTEYVSE